jgi:hypothetical protein
MVAPATVPGGREIIMKGLARIVVGALALTALFAGTASAQVGAPDMEVKENAGRVKVDGPGFTVILNRDDVITHIDDEEFGIPEAGFPIQRSQLTLGPNPNRRPFICENGTYRIVSATFTVTQRASSTEPRPLPYTPQFNAAFANIITFVGILEGTVVNESGEQFRLLVTDLAHEVMTPTEFSSTAPVHGFIVDAEGNVVDRASLVGLVNIDRTTGEAEHVVIDSGTCHQTANLNFGPGTDQAVVFGPIFVLPFNTTVVTP